MRSANHVFDDRYSKEVEEVVVAGVVGEVEAAFFDADGGDFLFAQGALEFMVIGEDGEFAAAVIVVSLFKEG
jgi:hypothetical protein